MWSRRPRPYMGCSADQKKKKKKKKNSNDDSNLGI
jgi:hypothetical protein